MEAADMPDIADATPVIFGDFKRGYPRFFNAIRHGHHRVIVGNDRKTGLPLDETEMPAFNLAMRTIYIIPVTKGRKDGDVGKVIADVVLTGLSAMTGGSAFMGTALRQSHGCPRPVSAVVAISFPLVRSALASVTPHALGSVMPTTGLHPRNAAITAAGGNSWPSFCVCIHSAKYAGTAPSMLTILSATTATRL
ncbi:hypothetical protein [Paenirhodobacter populi]|uniref:hypothetical protein n=1 Tax=Paenirhodobacter populi TaxID=2306993 RepID=UPI00240DF1AB|nr:hypothetical protein [Sinirhodobacter populi]